jgi:hypothetical protein
MATGITGVTKSQMKKSERYADEASKLYAILGLSVEGVANYLKIDYRTAREAIQLRTPLRDASARLVGRTRPDRSIK